MDTDGHGRRRIPGAVDRGRYKRARDTRKEYRKGRGSDKRKHGRNHSLALAATGGAWAARCSA